MLVFKETEHLPKHVWLQDAIGVLPLCWDANDPRDAISQHDERQMGNGHWSSFEKFTLNQDTKALKYPGDPEMKPWAVAELPLSKQMIYVYPHAWVMIFNADGSFTVDRRD